MITKRKTINADKVRQQIEERWRSPIKDGPWLLLVDDGLIGRIQAGQATIDDALEKLDQIQKAGRSLGARRAIDPEAPVLRSRKERSRVAEKRFNALSDLIAEEARGSAGVTDFRRTHLRALLDPGEVAKWLAKRVTKEKHSDSEAHPMSHHPEEIARIKAFWRNQGFEVLQFLEPSEPTRVWRRAYRLDRRPGVLEELRSLAEELAVSCGWSEAAAVRFVLTDEIPEIRPVEAWTSHHGQGLFPGLLRINLSVHYSVTPEELGKHWAGIRSQIITGDRHRNISDKHAALASFFATRDETEPLKKKMAAWNQSYPAWAYPEVRNFSRDATLARKRLLWLKGDKQ